MKKKRLVFISIIFLILILSGCKKEAPKTVKGVFEGGNAGVTAKFEQFGASEGGRYVIFDTESFPIQLTLNNRGEDDIGPGDITVKLRGISLSDFEGISSDELKNTQKLDKISEFNPDGGEETITFSEGAKIKQPVTGFYDVNLFALYEYLYSTKDIVPQVCLSGNPLNERVCKISGSKDNFVSGAPITVTGVSEEKAGKGIVLLKFDIKNAGGGRAVLPSEDFGVRTDKVAFSIDDPDMWNCKSGGNPEYARLDAAAKTASIVCKLNKALDRDEAYTKQVELTLDYRYQEIIQDTVRIKESLD